MPSLLFNSLLDCKLAYRAFHLQLDEPVQLHRVLQRDLLGDRLHEAVDHHGRGLVLGEHIAARNATSLWPPCYLAFLTSHTS